MIERPWMFAWGIAVLMGTAPLIAAVLVIPYPQPFDVDVEFLGAIAAFPLGLALTAKSINGGRRMTNRE